MATIPTPTLYPLNDFSMIAALKTIDTNTGKVIKLITGTVTFFIATSNAPGATAVNGALDNLTATHVGGGNWLLQIDGAAMTVSGMATWFATLPPFLIIVKPGDIREFLPLAYAASKPATLVAAS
jgi:hypothetical protein